MKRRKYTLFDHICMIVFMSTAIALTIWTIQIIGNSP